MIALVALIALALGENRAWIVEVEVAGPMESARLDCGVDGRTTLLGPLLAGERRTLRVPVPVRSPLGVDALASVPLPDLSTDPPEAAERCRVLGWRPGDEETLESAARVMLARPRPPAPAAVGARPGWPEGLATLLALAVLLRLRGRPTFQAAAGIGAGVALAALAAGHRVETGVRVLLEADRDVPTALRIVAARDRVGLAAHVEVRPDGGGVELRVPLVEGALGEALAPGRTLFAIEALAAPELEPANNRWGDLAQVWLRSGAGRWTAHGAWPRGAALGPARGATEPPGWLAAALPPGRTVLVAEVSGDQRTWLRVVGFPVPARESAPAGD